MTLHRIPRFPGLGGIRPGFSVKKLICDGFLSFLVLWLVIRRRPDVVHAVEESVFIAFFVRFLFGVPYIYDMDSSMPDQIIEKSPSAGFLAPVMHRLVRWAAGAALLVAPVCEALAVVAEGYRPRKTIVLRDVSLLKRPVASGSSPCAQLGIKGNCFMYVGNLESYQGIDLLLAAFAQHVSRRPTDALVIVGGPATLVDHYRDLCAKSGIAASVHFLGPLPIDLMPALFDDADVLVSPRIKGSNTPMKVYSYLDSGKPVLATRLPTHTQAMDDETSFLADTTPEAFSAGMTALSDDPALRERLARNARELVQSSYSVEAFERTVYSLYGHVADELRSKPTHEPQPG